MAEPDIAIAKLQRDTAERFQHLRRELGANSLGINLIVLQPGQRSRIHAHEHQEEEYLVLEGELTLVVEGVEHTLGADEIARVGAATRRQIANKGRARLVLLALGAAGQHESRDAIAWTSWREDGPGRPPQEVPLPDDDAVA
jgi:uncharacterized cupin superfamily protein